MLDQGLEQALKRAEAVCLARGAQLTELRRSVLKLVLMAEQPMGAYALLDKLKESRGSAAPPTVYRALDFLLEQGLIHKVERLNAFIGCVEPHSHGHAHDGHDHGHHAHEGHTHPHQFLICRTCGSTQEISDAGVAAALKAAAAAAGFQMTQATVEIEGICSRCAAA